MNVYSFCNFLLFVEFIFQSCEEEIMQLAQSLRNAPYNDPSAEPEQVIAELRKVS